MARWVSLNWMQHKSLLRTTAVVLVAIVVVFVGANLADYIRYTRALARAKGLTQDQLRAIGDWCLKAPKGERRILKAKDIPVEFLPLNPDAVTCSNDFTEVQLYLLRDIRLEFQVEAWSDNQVIGISIVDSDPPQWTPLWHRDPDLAKKINPDHRLLTIRHNDKDWIVLSDKIIVLGRRIENNMLRSFVLADVSITKVDQALLLKTIQAIPRETKGNDYRYAGNEWPTTESLLTIIFSADGRRTPGDILAINAWVDTLAPLLGEVSKLAPKGYPIEHKEMTTAFVTNPQLHPVEVTTGLGTSYSVSCDPPPEPPWWCVWRSLLKNHKKEGSFDPA